MAIFFKKEEQASFVEYRYKITKRGYGWIAATTVLLAVPYAINKHAFLEKINNAEQIFFAWLIFLAICYFVAQVEFTFAIIKLARKSQTAGGAVSIGHGSHTLLKAEGPLAANISTGNWILFPGTTVKWNK